MAAKFLLCAVFALFAVQALNAHPSSQTGLEDAIHDALLKVKEALHQLTLKLEALGNAAVEKIQAVIEVIKQKGQELLDQALQQLHVIEAAIEAKIQELIQLAAENGVDISECVAVERAAVEELKKHTREELASCVSEQVKQAEAIMDDVIALVKSGLAELKQSEENVEQCLTLEKPLEVLGCLKEEASKATQEALRLAGLIGQELVKAQKLIAQSLHEIPACIFQKLAAAEQSGAAIVQEFKACVMDKINNKPTTPTPATTTTPAATTPTTTTTTQASTGITIE